MVFALLFMGVLLLSLGFLYKAGRLTSDRMELQNAADAAAYSVALTEARDLNFAAYINRAMVANEVAIGQLVGLASWAFHWYSIGDFLRYYNAQLLAPATLGISTAIIEPVASVFNISGGVLVTITSTLARLGVSVLRFINYFYSLAQFGFHTVSALFSIGVIDETITRNAPAGARLSESGIAHLVLHFASYGSLPLPIPGGAFTASYSPSSRVTKDEYDAGDKGDLEGYEKLAAVIRDSRDPFTMSRGWAFGLFTPFESIIEGIDTPDWLNLDVDDKGTLTVEADNPPPFPLVIDIGVAEAGIELSVWFKFGIALLREGGSELRLVLPAAGAGQISGQTFNWTGADATSLALTFGGGFDVEAYLELLGEEVARTSFGASLLAENDLLNASFTVFGEEITLIDDLPFPLSAPFGAGYAEASRTGTPSNKFIRFPHLAREPVGQLSGSEYGGAAGRILGWEAVPPVGAPSSGVAYQATNVVPSTRWVNQSYAGLPRFVDTTGNDSTLLGFGAPYVTISLVLDQDEFAASRVWSAGESSRGGPAPEMTGDPARPLTNLKLTERMPNDQMQSVARGQVYFSRPNDLDYFARADGQEEYGNAFNPYWNARLVESRYIDKIVAALIQQQEDFTGSGEVFDLLDGFLEDLIP
jgi:hypothetical protein